LNGQGIPARDQNIIFTVHFYHPMKFTHQGAPWSKANDRPIFLGEFGSCDKADMESCARYTAYVVRTAEKLGFSWAYWQFDSDFHLAASFFFR
jgi:endoglucanase